MDIVFAPFKETASTKPSELSTLLETGVTLSFLLRHFRTCTVPQLICISRLNRQPTQHDDAPINTETLGSSIVMSL